MKKTDEAIARFKPPFNCDSNDVPACVEDSRGEFVCQVSEEGDVHLAQLIVESLNFYYANQRERSERKGEKE